jgi:hypothetical protein
VTPSGIEPAGKAVGIAYSECVSVALISQHAKRVPPIIFSSVACLASPYFSALFYKRHDKMCRLIFCPTLIGSTSHFKSNLARYYHKFKKKLM